MNLIAAFNFCFQLQSEGTTLRGKILNVDKKDEDAILKNTEISNMVNALGLGFKGDAFDESKLRYGKIVILTDADVDGAHIRTLLLTFLFRYQRALFEQGGPVQVDPGFSQMTPRLLSALKTKICWAGFKLCFQLQPAPLQQGKIFVAVPPLYKVEPKGRAVQVDPRLTPV